LLRFTVLQFKVVPDQFMGWIQCCCHFEKHRRHWPFAIMCRMVNSCYWISGTSWNQCLCRYKKLQGAKSDE